MNANKQQRITAGRYLQALAVAKGSLAGALAFAESQGHWLDRAQIARSLKGAIAAQTTEDFSDARTPSEDAFLGEMRPFSVPRSLPDLRMVPMRCRLFLSSGGVIAVEVNEAAPIPIFRGDWSTVTLLPRKHAGGTVQTAELAASTEPVASAAFADDLTQATGEAESRSFIDPSLPGSVLAAAPAFGSSGTTAAAITQDVAQLVDAVPGAGRGGAFVGHPASAAHIALSLQLENLGPAGGHLLGLPFVTSTQCQLPGSPAVRVLALVSQREIFFAEGRVELSASKAAALQQDDAPTAGPAAIVSMFQTDSIALKAIVESAWHARANSAAYFTVGY